MDTPDYSELLGPAEVAKLLGVERHAVDRMIRLGKLPARRMTSLTLVRKADVERLLTEGKKIPKPRPASYGNQRAKKKVRVV